MSESNYFTESLLDEEVARPTARTWIKHLILFALAFITVTIAGTLPPFGLVRDVFPNENPQTAWEFAMFIVALPGLYADLIYQTIILLFTRTEYLAHGLSFSISLLFILTSHEAGHYIAARIYRVDVTLPYFIPTPPLIGPAGTLGAFIKILSPLPSRRATFDIGIAGPIAGFLALIPVSIVGFLTMEPARIIETDPSNIGLYFSDSLFTQILAYLFGHDLNLPTHNPFYFATWIGLLVTSLNLIPSGQLDGGHAVYAVFGKRAHNWTGKIAFIIMSILSILGMYYYSSPSGLLFAVLLGVMLKVRHPEPLDDAPLDTNRKIIAIITLVIFILCFVPFPIQVL